jgi:hypothetical protein
MKKSFCYKFTLPLLSLIILQGCYSSIALDRSTFMTDPSYKINKVITIDGKAYVFEPYLANFSNNKIIGISNEKLLNITADDIDSVVVQKIDTGRTCLFFGTGLVVAAIVLIVQFGHDFNETFKINK